jgi:ketosteroid isomerase-like protein
MKMRWFVAVCLLASLAVPCCVTAQQPVPAAEQAELTRTVTDLDTKLFDAYNHCDLKTLGAMVADDLEFYHDQTGLMVGKAPFLAAIQQNICGKVERTLVPGSLEVYRLKGYGAVEIGVHRFHKAGHPEDLGGEAKFVHLWQNKDGVWRVTRVISYNHESLTK